MEFADDTAASYISRKHRVQLTTRDEWGLYSTYTVIHSMNMNRRGTLDLLESQVHSTCPILMKK